MGSLFIENTEIQLPALYLNPSLLPRVKLTIKVQQI